MHSHYGGLDKRALWRVLINMLNIQTSDQITHLNKYNIIDAVSAGDEFQ